MNIQHLKLGALALALVGLTGCGRYKASSLRKLAPHVSPFTKEENVGMLYHIFTREDCLTYLDRNVLMQGYQPVQVTIYNNSSRTFNFSPHNFNVPCADPAHVAEMMHDSPIHGAVGFGILSVVFPPFTLPFVIPAIADSVSAFEANKLMDADFIRKALHSQTIAPFTIINGLIFVRRRAFHPDLRLALYDQATNKRYILHK